MGNLADKIFENKNQLTLGCLALAAGSFALYNKYETDQLRKLAHSIDPYIPLLTSYKIDEVHEEID